MKKANTVVARNIINNDEIDAFCNEQAERHPTLTNWITKVLRKWLLQKAPAVKYNAAPQEGMPAWLQNAINTNTAESVVIDAALSTRLAPILDYLDAMVAEKPNTDQTRISFDQAEKGAEKWHAAMAKKLEKQNRRAEPIAEDGATVVKTYDDGYYWVKLTGKNSMKREGDLMGHCVGRFGYFNENLAGRKTIFSLRDPDNNPHCTIEVDKKPGNTAIYQVKGKANLEVKPAYLKYVKDFMLHSKWDTVNFDGAKAVADEVHDAHRAKKTWTGPNGTKIRRDIEAYYHNRPLFLIEQPSHHGMHGDKPREVQRGPYNFSGLSDKEASDFTDYLLSQEIYLDTPDGANVGYGRLQWNTREFMPNYFVMAPTNELAHVLVKALSRGDQNAQVIIEQIGGEHFIGVIDNAKINLIDRVTKKESVFDILEHLPSIKSAKVFVDGKEDDRLTKFYQHRHAGANVQAGESNKQTLDTFLEALRLPGTAQIAAAAKALKGKTELTDGDFKAHGIPTGGNTTMAYSLILVLSQLPRVPALEYLVSKPHAFRNWTEVMREQMAAFLDRMKFTEAVKSRINAILLNEYMHLLPTPGELRSLSINEVESNGLEAVMKHVGNKRAVPAQSKQLWS